MCEPFTKLKVRFPELYKDLQTFDCKLGWYSILLELSLVLSNLVRLADWEVGLEPKVTEVFEKNGRLICNMDYSTSQMQNYISQAREVSEQTCEKCGDHGRRRKVEGKYLTRCDNCLGSKTKERSF